MEIAIGHGEGQNRAEGTRAQNKGTSWAVRVLPLEFNEIVVLNKFLSGVKGKERKLMRIREGRA